MAKRILIADDKSDDRLFLKKRLARLAPQPIGCITEAYDGESLLAEARKQPYDLIITDNNMPPGMDGIYAVKQLRAEGYAGKIMVLSGTDNPKFPEQAKAAGADYFVNKNGAISGKDEFDKQLRQIFQECLQ